VSGTLAEGKRSKAGQNSGGAAVEEKRQSRVERGAGGRGAGTERVAGSYKNRF